MNDGQSPMIEVANLHKTYRLGRGNTVHALRGVDASVEAGEMVAIMGPSGCGKSTLLHLMGLLHLPDRDSEPLPKVVFAGRDVTNLSDGERTRMRASAMGFVFQSFNLVPVLTAAENVALAAEYAGASRKQAETATREALGWVGLEDRARHRPAELSGGEQQRVAVARALVNSPSLVLADEPTGNLDSTNSAAVMDLLRRLNGDWGQTMVLVTHDPEVADRCDRRLLMRDGLIVDEADAG